MLLGRRAGRGGVGGTRAGLLDGRRAVLGRTGFEDVLGEPACRLATDVGVAVSELGAGAGTDAAEGRGRSADVFEQARRVRAVPSSATARTARLTGPESHDTPMRIRGCAPGESHRMIETRVPCGIETQPAVAEPSLTCRKNALPAPWRTEPVLAVL